MADLGHLRLHLSASLGQLRADLAAAKLLAKNARAEMQAELSTPIDWGLTKGLRRELVVVESLFAASLNRMDAMAVRGVQIRVGIDKRSLVDAVVEVQSAIPDIKLRVGIDRRSINDAVVEIHSAISHITSKSIKINVDDSALTRLNEHYKIKWQDHDETVRRLAKPIVLHVDDSELAKHRNGKQVLHQKITIGFDYGEVDRIGKDIGRSIGNSIQAGGTGGIGRIAKGLGSIAVAPIKVGFDIAAFPVRELAKGMLQGFGRDLSRGLSQSFAGAVNESLSSSIGSMDLVGRKLGEAGTREVKRAYVSYTADRPELSGSIAATGAATRSFLGEKDVAIEANKSRGKQQQKQRQDLSLAQNGVLAEIRAVEGELNRAETSYVNAVRALKTDIEALTKEQIKDQAKYQQIARLRQSGRLTPNRSAAVDRQQQQLVARESQRAGMQAAINNQLEPRAADVLIAQQRESTAMQQLQALQGNAKPKAYQQLLDIIAPGLPKHLTPTLVEHNFESEGRAGTRGSYSPLQNRIRVDPEIAKQIKQGRLDEKSAFILSEEIRHAQDFKFGQFAGVAAHNEKRLIDTPVKATIKEEQAVAPNLLEYDPSLRAIERNAKIRAKRDASKYTKEQVANELNERVGPGGQYLQAVTDGKFKNLNGRVEGRINLSKQVGKSLPSLNKLEQDLIKLKSARTQLIERITIAQTSESSATEIQGLQKEVDRHLNAIDSIDKRVGAAGRAIPKARAASNKSSSAITLNQVGEIVSAVGGKTKKVVEMVMPVVRGAVEVAQHAYGALEGAENVAFGVLPGSRTIKKVAQATVVPAALYSAVQAIPGAPIISYGLQSATQSMLSLPASGITGALDGVIAGSMGALPGIGGTVSAAVSSLSGGIVDLAVSSAAGVLAPILGGAAIQKAGSSTLRAIAPSTDTKKAKSIGQGVAQKVRDSFEVTISPLDSLPEAPTKPALLPEKAAPLAKRVSNKEVLARIDKNLKTLRILEKNLVKDISSGALSSPGSLSRIAESIKEQADDYKNFVAAIKADPERAGIEGQLKNRKGQFTRINNDIQRSLTVARNRSGSVESQYESYSKEGDVEEQLRAMKNALSGKTSPSPGKGTFRKVSANYTEAIDQGAVDLAALKASRKGKLRPLTDLEIFQATYSSAPDPDEEDKQITALKRDLPKRGIGVLRRTRVPRRTPLNNAIYDPEIVKAQNLSDQLAAKVQDFEVSAQQIRERVGDSIGNDNPENYRIRGISRKQQRIQARGLTPEILAAKNVAGRAAQNIAKYDRAAETIEAEGFTTTPQTPIQKVFSAVTAPLAQANKGFESLKNNFVNLGLAGGGILALAGITTMITAWGVASVQTAAQLQDLKTSFNLVTRSQAGATAAIQQSAALSDQFGVNKIDNLRADVGFRGATKDSAIELVSADIASSVTQYGRVAGVSNDRIALVKTALQQIAGKDLKAEEIYGQGEESLPGFARILASGVGLTPQQLRKQVEKGSLNSADVLPRFALAAKSESDSGADSAAKSATASFGRLTNAITDLQAATGDQLLGPATVGLNAAAGSAKFLADNMGVISTIGVGALGATAVQAVGLDNIAKSIGGSFRAAGSAISSFAQAPLSSLVALKKTAKEASLAMAPLLQSIGTTALITLGIGAFQSLHDTLSNTSPMREAAVQMRALAASTNQAAEAAKNLGNEKFNKDRNIFELASDTINAPIRALGVNIETVAESKAAIDIKNIKAGQVDSQIGIAKNSAGISGVDQEKLYEIEKEIRLVRARKATLTASDRSELTAADKEEQELILRRKQLEQPIFDNKANLKNTIKFNQNLLDDPYYRSEIELAPQRSQALINIANAEKAIAELDKVLGKTPEETDKARRGLERLSNELSTATAIAQRAKVIGSTEIDQRLASINPLDTGGKQGETFKLNQKAITEELTALQRAIAKAQQEISRPIFQQELAIYKSTGKLPDSLQNTSDDQLEELTKLKASPELIALIRKIKATKNRIDNLNQENAGQVAEYQRAVAENAKSAKEYYRSAANEFQKTALDTQAARQQFVTADLGSRYKSAIQGVGGSLTGFITAMTDAMVEMRSVTQIELERRKKDLAIQQEKIQQDKKYRNEANSYVKGEIASTEGVSAPVAGASISAFSNYNADGSQVLGAPRGDHKHQGIDFDHKVGIRAGTPIAAIHDGIATIGRTRNQGYNGGLLVTIKWADGQGQNTIKQIHLDEKSVIETTGRKVGDSFPVRAGQPLGRIQALGLRNTTDHLHAEWWVNNQMKDIRQLFKAGGVSARGLGASAGNGANSSGVSQSLVSATLDYIGQKESNNNYYAKNDGGSFPRSEAVKGFPASQSFKQPVKTKKGIKYIMPNVGRYQFNKGDYELAQKIDPSITNFLPENQDKIAKIKIFRLGRGGAELKQYQQNPTLENADQVRKGLGNEWQIFHTGNERAATSKHNYWNRNGNTTEKFHNQLKDYAIAPRQKSVRVEPVKANLSQPTNKPIKKGDYGFNGTIDGSGIIKLYKADGTLGTINDSAANDKKRKIANQAILPGRNTGILLVYDSSVVSDSNNLFSGQIAGNNTEARGFGNNRAADGYQWGKGFTSSPANNFILPSKGIGGFSDSIQNLQPPSSTTKVTIPAPSILPLPVVKRRAVAPPTKIVVPAIITAPIAPLPSSVRKRRKGVSADGLEPAGAPPTVGPISDSLFQEVDPTFRRNVRADSPQAPGSASTAEANVALAKTANDKIQAALDEQRTINNESAAAQTRNAKRQSLAKERQAERDRIVQQRGEVDKITARERDNEKVRDPIGDDTPQKRKRIADRERVYAGKDRQLKLQRDLEDLEQEIKAVETWQKESKATPDKDLLPEEIRIRDRIAAVVKVELPKLKEAANNIRKFYLPQDIKNTNDLTTEADRVAGIESKKNRTEAQSGTRSAEITRISELKKKSEVHLQSYPLDYKKFGDPLDYQKQIELLNAENTFESEQARIEKASRDDPFNAPQFDKQKASARAAYDLAKKNAVASYHTQFELRNLGITDTALNLTNRQGQGNLVGAEIVATGQGLKDRQDAPFANDELLKLREKNELLAEQLNLAKVLVEIEKERRQYAGNSAVVDKLDAIKANEIVNSTARQEQIPQKYAIEAAEREIERKKSLAVRIDRIQASGFAVRQAGIDGRQALGISPREEGYKLQVDQRSNYYDQQVRNLEIEKSAITGTGEQASFARREIDALIADMERLRSIELGNLAKQFDPLNQALNSVQRQTRSVAEEFVKTGKFDIGSIIKSGLDNLLGKTLDKLTTDLFSNLYRGSGAAGTNPAKGASGGSIGGFLGTILGSVLGFADGGPVVANGTESLMAKDDFIAKGLRKEAARSGGKPTMIFATIDEEVLDRDEAARYRSMFPNGIGGHATGGTIGKLPPQNKIKLPPLQNLGGIGLPKINLPALNQNLSNISNNSNTTSNVTVNNSGSTPEAQGDGSQFGELLGAAIVQKIIELQRQGLVPRPA